MTTIMTLNITTDHAVSEGQNRRAKRDRLAGLADPGCERCEGSGLDPDRYTTTRRADGRTIYHLTEPCEDCIEDDLGDDPGEASAPAEDMSDLADAVAEVAAAIEIHGRAVARDDERRLQINDLAHELGMPGTEAERLARRSPVQCAEPEVHDSHAIPVQDEPRCTVALRLVTAIGRQVVDRHLDGELVEMLNPGRDGDPLRAAWAMARRYGSLLVGIPSIDESVLGIEIAACRNCVGQVERTPGETEWYHATGTLHTIAGSALCDYHSPSDSPLAAPMHSGPRPVVSMSEAWDPDGEGPTEEEMADSHAIPADDEPAEATTVEYSVRYTHPVEGVVFTEPVEDHAMALSYLDYVDARKPDAVLVARTVTTTAWLPDPGPSLASGPIDVASKVSS